MWIFKINDIVTELWIGIYVFVFISMILICISSLLVVQKYHNNYKPGDVK